MKRAIALLLIVCLALPLGGCGREATWRWELETWTDADDYTARDGTLLSWYVWKLPRLALVSADAPYGAEPPSDMAAVRDAFNAEMEQQHALLRDEYHELEQLAIKTYIATGAEPETPPCSRVEVAETYRTPRLLSVRVEGYTDWGGAYPWHFVRAWSFDLETGKFVQWYDLASDAAALRGAVASAVRAQIEARGLDTGYFPGWEDTVESLDGCAVFLGADALTVVFGEQQLAPRAAGLPAFEAPYDALTKSLSSYGRQLIKKEG